MHDLEFMNHRKLVIFVCFLLLSKKLFLTPSQNFMKGTRVTFMAHVSTLLRYLKVINIF